MGAAERRDAAAPLAVTSDVWNAGGLEGCSCSQALISPGALWCCQLRDDLSLPGFMRVQVIQHLLKLASRSSPATNVRSAALQSVDQSV